MQDNRYHVIMHGSGTNRPSLIFISTFMFTIKMSVLSLVVVVVVDD